MRTHDNPIKSAVWKSSPRLNPFVGTHHIPIIFPSSQPEISGFHHPTIILRDPIIDHWNWMLGLGGFGFSHQLFPIMFPPFFFPQSNPHDHGKIHWNPILSSHVNDFPTIKWPWYSKISHIRYAQHCPAIFTMKYPMIFTIEISHSNYQCKRSWYFIFPVDIPMKIHHEIPMRFPYSVRNISHETSPMKKYTKKNPMIIPRFSHHSHHNYTSRITKKSFYKSSNNPSIFPYPMDFPTKKNSRNSQPATSSAKTVTAPWPATTRSWATAWLWPPASRRSWPVREMTDRWPALQRMEKYVDG